PAPWTSVLPTRTSPRARRRITSESSVLSRRVKPAGKLLPCSSGLLDLSPFEHPGSRVPVLPVQVGACKDPVHAGGGACPRPAVVALGNRFAPRERRSSAMFFSLWRRLRNRNPGLSTRQCLRGGQRPSYRPQLDPLEDRLLPALGAV